MCSVLIPGYTVYTTAPHSGFCFKCNASFAKLLKRKV